MRVVGILLGLAAIVMVSIVGAILALMAVIARSDVTDCASDAIASMLLPTYNCCGSTAVHASISGESKCGTVLDGQNYWPQLR